MDFQSIKSLQIFHVSYHSGCIKDLTSCRLWFLSLSLLSSEYVDYWDSDRKLGAWYRFTKYQVFANLSCFISLRMQ